MKIEQQIEIYVEMKGKRMKGFDNWFVVENIFGCEFCFSNAEIMNVVANGLRGELVLELQVNDLVKTHPKKWKKWDLVYIKNCFFGVKEISMFVNHEHICIKEFLVEKLEKDFEYELKVLCNQNYINCTYAIARIQNIKPLVWDDNFQYYIVPE